MEQRDTDSEPEHSLLQSTPGAHGQLHLTVTPHPAGAVVLHAHGEIDTLTAPLLAAQVRACIATASRTVVNLAEVSFLASAGLTVLLEARDQAIRVGRPFQLICGDSTATRRILRAAGLVTSFDLLDS